MKRREFNKAVLAAVGGIVAGSALGCRSSGNTDRSHLPGHACKGRPAMRPGWRRPCGADQHPPGEDRSGAHGGHLGFSGGLGDHSGGQGIR